MTSPSGDQMVEPWRKQPLFWLARQMMLVPEGLLLPALIGLHLITGRSVATALAGLMLVVAFVVRSAVLAVARRAVHAACYGWASRLVWLTLRLHPWSADGLALRGALHMAQGQAEQSEAALRRALALFPGQAQLHAALSGALLELGRNVEARWEGMRALTLDPMCAGAYLHLAQAEQRLGVLPQDVERHLRQGLAVCADPATEAALRCTLALQLLSSGHHSEARLVAQGVEALAVRCAPQERAATLFQLGEVQRALGDQDAARGLFHASERLDPHGRYAAAAWRAARV